jgi:V/A-type H+-transporting ATPase subunit I
VRKELERINVELRALATRFASPLFEIEEIAETERRLLEMEQTFPRTEATVLLTGWVPADRKIAVEDCIKKSTADRCVFEVAAPDNSGEEYIPVLLKHSRLLRPFETLVSTYGLPDYRELEPTLFVA